MKKHKKKLNLKINLKIARIKDSAMKANLDNMLPYELVHYIMQMNDETCKEEVEFLLNGVHHFMRLKGYYKKYPDIHKDINKLIREEYERRKETWLQSYKNLCKS